MTQYVKASRLADTTAPFTDATGRVRYIVQFTDKSREFYPDTVPNDARTASWHKSSVRNLVADYSAKYGFVPINMTSWAGTTVTAYLSDEQVAELRKNSLVKSVTIDGRVSFSAPLWADSPGPPFKSWGTLAIGHAPSPVTGIKVYVLDSGIGTHADLNVVERINPVPSVNPVGCLAHSVHVAGIIGANGGSVGVAPGVPIVSVTANDYTDSFQPCSLVLDDSSSQAHSNLAAAVDLIMSKISQNGQVGVVNISQNSAALASTGIVGQHIGNLATPMRGYPGAFVVQSAGNFYGDACNTAMSTSGVFVVGALDINGQAVRPLNDVGGFRNSTVVAGSQPGSNFGSCVTIWAPGNNIYSTWAATPRVGGGLPVQRSDTSYTLHSFLSGTSMAAPHIAGMAAYLASAYGLTTPDQIAQAVLARSYNLGSFSQGGQAIKTANLTGARPTAAPTVEIAIDGAPNGTISRTADQSFRLRYESVGAQSCTITATLNGTPWYQVPNHLPAYDWGNVYLYAGNYTWTIDCVSAQGAHSVATASATITPAGSPVPVVEWFVNGASVNGQDVYLPTQNSIMLKYGASGSSYCVVSTRYGPNPGTTLVPWYTSPPIYAPNYDWGPVQYTPYTYEYTATCYNAQGVAASATFRLRVF